MSVRKSEGITPILGTMLLLVIILTMIATVLYWATPTIKAIELDTQVTSATGYFQNANKEVRGLINDGWGCGRNVKLSLSTGGIQMYSDQSDLIEPSEVKVDSGFQPKTPWVMGYNMPDSRYDILFDGLTDELTDKFTIRNLEGSTFSGMVTVECLQGERAGETQSVAVTLALPNPPKADIAITLYDASRITLQTTATPPVVLAQAYVFSLGSIYYFLPSDHGTFHFILQNTGLAMDYPSSPTILTGLLTSECGLSNGVRTLTIYMANFNPRGIYASESGDVTLAMRYSKVGFYGNQDVRGLRLSVGGEYREPWYTSLTDNYLHSHATSVEKYSGFIADSSQNLEPGVIYNVPSSVTGGGKDQVRLNIVWANVDVEIRS